MTVRYLTLLGMIVVALVAAPPAPGSVRAAAPAAMLAGTATGIERSVDGGRTWRAANDGLPKRAYISALATAPNNPSIIYAGVWAGGIYISQNAGISWQPDNGTDIALAHSAVTDIAVDPTNALRLRVAGAGDGIEASENGGHAWTHVNGALLSSVGVIAVNPRNPAILLVGSNVYGVLRSTDRGHAWKRVNSGAMGPIYSLAYDPVSPAVIYVAAYGGLYQTIDGAYTWQQDRRGIHGADFRSVAVDPRNGANVIAATHGGDIYHSTNGGTSWTLAGNAFGFPAYAIAFDPARPSHVLLGYNHGLLGSDDHGRSWSPKSALRNRQVNVIVTLSR